MTARGNELECISTVEPGATVNIPVKAVYTPTSELFFSVSKYSVTASPFVWKDLQMNLSITKLLQCRSKYVDHNDSFIIKVSITNYYIILFISIINNNKCCKQN